MRSRTPGTPEVPLAVPGPAVTLYRRRINAERLATIRSEYDTASSYVRRIPESKFWRSLVGTRLALV